MNDNSPAVSVVVPTYNRGHVLDRSIRSVLEQTYTDFELIVIDDGSTDHTAEVVAKHDDARIEYLEHERNRGAAAARNTGIRAASGEFIAFQDSDDEWSPRKIEEQMDVFDRSPPDVGVVYSPFVEVLEWGTEQLRRPDLDPLEGDLRRSLLKFNFITMQAAVVRRECFRTVGLLDEDLPRLIDWELWIRIAEQYRFRFVDEPLVRVYRRSDSISRDDVAGVVARKRILDKHRERFDTRELAYQQFWVGHGFLKVGNAEEGRDYLARAVENDLRIVYLATFFVSLLGSHVYNAVYRVIKETRTRVTPHSLTSSHT